MAVTDINLTPNRTWLLQKEYAVAKTFDSAADKLLAVDGIIASGIIYPANDATAQGIIINDVVVDVDNSSEDTAALLVKGVVSKNFLPDAPTQAAVDALFGNITFIDGAATVPAS